MTPRHCAECGARGGIKLPVRWRQYLVPNATRRWGFAWVRVCSLLCEMQWLKWHPEAVRSGDGHDEESWRWVA